MRPGVFFAVVWGVGIEDTVTSEIWEPECHSDVDFLKQPGKEVDFVF